MPAHEQEQQQKLRLKLIYPLELANITKGHDTDIR